MSLQKQLDTAYHTDSFIRDHLLTAVDLPNIQTPLRDRMSRTSQQVVNIIANQLCDRKNSAGSSACISHDTNTGDPEVMY